MSWAADMATVWMFSCIRAAHSREMDRYPIGFPQNKTVVNDFANFPQHWFPVSCIRWRMSVLCGLQGSLFVLDSKSLMDQIPINIFVIGCLYNPRCLLLVPTCSFSHFASLHSKSLRCQEPGISPNPRRSWFGIASPYTHQEEPYWKKENWIIMGLGSDQLKAISLEKTQTNKQTTKRKHFEVSSRMSITLDWHFWLQKGLGYGAFIIVTDGIAENSPVEPRAPRPLTQFHCIFLKPIRLCCCGGPFFPPVCKFISQGVILQEHLLI